MSRLVVTRKRKQSLKVGRATITVQHATRKTVRLAVEAPPSVSVVRSELAPLALGAAAAEIFLRREAPPHLAAIFEQHELGDLVLVLPAAWRGLLLPVVAGRLVAEHSAGDELVMLVSSKHVPQTTRVG